MRGKAKRIVSIFLALMMILTGIPGRQAAVKKATAAGVTYEKGSDLGDLLGLMQEFGIFAFTEVRDISHVHSNMITGNLLANPDGQEQYASGEFTIKDGNGRTASSSFVNYIGKFSELQSKHTNMMVGYTGDRLVVGSENSIENYDTGKFRVNGCTIQNSSIVEKETNSEKFINLSNLQRSFGYYSGQLAAMPETGAVADLAKTNGRTITTNLSSGVAVINIKASAMNGSNNQINIHTSGAVLVINVDMEGATSYTFPAAIGTVINGSAVERGEENFRHPENNRVIWNFIDSTKPDGRFRGEITINALTAGTILAPYGKVTSKENGIEGVLVADKVEIRGEFHRINPYSGFPQPKPISNADFGLIKTYAGADLTALTDAERKELLDNTKFTLYKQNGTTVVAGPKALSWNVDKACAEVLFQAVNCGTSSDTYYFKLKETQAPNGYTMSDITVDCKVVRDAKTGLLKAFYKRSTEDASAYSEAFPSFENTKKQAIHPEVEIDSWKYGETSSEPSIKAGGNPGNAEVTYTYYKKNSDNTYTELSGKPQNAGGYKVVANVAETAQYESGTASKEFHIDMADNTLTATSSQVSVQRSEEYHDPNTIDLSKVISGGNGDITYTIEGNDYGCSVDSSGVFSSGNEANKTVTVKITAGGDENHNPKTVSVTVNVTTKKVNSPSVSMEDWTYGETVPTPVVTNNQSTHKPTYEYVNTDTNENLGEKPELPGNYKVIITVKGDKNYEQASASDTFTIHKATPTVTVSQEGWTYGETATQPVHTETGVKKQDNITVESIQYKEKGDSDSSYTSTVPTDAGTYIVRVTTKEDAKYFSTSKTAEFTIAKASDPGEVTKTADVMRDNSIDLSTLVSGAKGEVSFAITSDNTGSSVSGTTLNAGNKAGTVIVTVTITDSDNHVGRTEQITITVGDKKTIVNPEVTITGWTYGEYNSSTNAPHITDTSNPGGATDITYRYKKAGEGDEAYTTKVPTEAGTYYVQAVIPETSTYCGATPVKQFVIEKAKNDLDEKPVTDEKVMRGGEVSLKDYAKDANGEVTYALETPVDGVSVDKDGKLTVSSDVLKDTEIIVKISAAGDKNHDSEEKIVTVKVLDKNPSTLSVTISGKEYDGTTAISSISGIPDGVTPEILYQKKNASGVYEDIPSGTVPKDAGEYRIIVTTAETATICGATVEKEFVISHAPVTVTADDKTIVYGSGDPTLTYKTEGLKDESTILIVKLEIYPDTLEVGNHSITPVGEKIQGNYEITYVPGVLKVEKAEIPSESLKLEQKDITYGEELPVPVIKGLPDELDPDDFIIEYKPKEGGSYDTKVPTEAGEYTVRVTIPESLHYIEKTLETEFKIELAEDPAVIDTVDKEVLNNPDSESPSHSVNLEDLVSGAKGKVTFAIDPDLSEVKDATIKSDGTLVPGKGTGTLYVVVKVDGSDNHYGKEKTIKIIVKEKPKEDPKEDPKTDPKEDPKTDPKEDPKEDPHGIGGDGPEDPHGIGGDGPEDPKTDPKEDPKEDPHGIGGDGPEDPHGIGGDGPETPDPSAKTLYKADIGGKKTSYLKGTKKPIPVAFHGSKGVEKLIESFLGISVGGKALVKGEDFTLDGKGVVTFLPKFLETLPAGEYSVVVSFADGDAVLLSLIVTIPPATDASPTTGDAVNVLLIWFILFLAGAMLSLVMAVKQRRAYR